MKKKDLKTGMIVRVFYDNKLYLVIEDCNTELYGEQELLFMTLDAKHFLVGEYYNNDLKRIKNIHNSFMWDIIEVYENSNNVLCDDIIDETKLKLLWERID